jgi:hypothetical protein
MDRHLIPIEVDIGDETYPFAIFLIGSFIILM